MCTFKTQWWNSYRITILISKGRNRKDKRSNRFKVTLKLNRQITLNPILLGSMSHLTDPHILDTLRQELVPQSSGHPICIVLLSAVHSATPCSWTCTLLHTGGSWQWRWPHCHSLLGIILVKTLCPGPAPAAALCLGYKPMAPGFFILQILGRDSQRAGAYWMQQKLHHGPLGWLRSRVKNVDWSSKCEVAQRQHLSA